MVIIGPDILKILVNKTALVLMKLTKLTFSLDCCIPNVNSNVSIGHQKLTIMSFGLD